MEKGRRYPQYRDSTEVQTHLNNQENAKTESLGKIQGDE